MSAEIHSFPKERIVREAVPEELQKRMKTNFKNFLNMLMMEESNEILSRLYTAGVNIKDPNFVRNYSLGINFINAAVMRSANFEHPMDELSLSLIEKMKEQMPTHNQEIEETIDNLPLEE